MNTIVNFIIFQTVWFLCICYADSGALWSLPLLAIHLIFSEHRRDDLKMMALMLVVGLMVDGGLNSIGFFQFNSAAFPIPFWLLTIWLAVAILFHHSLAWLKNHLILATLFGAIGGPLAYWSGVRMGAAGFIWPLVPSLTVIAILWAIIWPAAVYAASRNFRDDRPPEAFDLSRSARRLLSPKGRSLGVIKNRLPASHVTGHADADAHVPKPSPSRWRLR